MTAVATSKEAEQIVDYWRRIEELILLTRGIAKKYRHLDLGRIEFTVPEAIMPYEKTEREIIPEKVRSQIWRRDQGMCVKCGSKNNLQFDHIIPVAKGGATTYLNLQLLCKTCNQKKSAKI